MIILPILLAVALIGKTQAVPADSLRHALMNFAGCQGKRYNPASGYVEAKDCEESRWIDQGIRITLDYKNLLGWTARASSKGFHGDCVYLVGVPQSEDDFRTSSKDHRSNFFMGVPYCDGDAPETGAVSWAQFLQLSAERQLNMLVGRIERLQRSGAAFPKAATELMGTDPFYKVKELKWTSAGWGVELSFANFARQSCIIWSGNLDGVSVKTRMNALSTEKKAKCDTFTSPAKP